MIEKRFDRGLFNSEHAVNQMKRWVFEQTAGMPNAVVTAHVSAKTGELVVQVYENLPPQQGDNE